MPPRSKAGIVSTSIGQQALARACEATGGGAAVARRLGFTKQRVHEWATGRKVPDLLARDRMSGILGIPTPAWDQPLNLTMPDARQERIASRQAAAEEAERIAAAPPPEDTEPDLPPTPQEGLVQTHDGEIVEQSPGRAQLTDLLLDTQRRRKRAIGPERLKLGQLEGNLLKQLIASEDKELARQKDLFESQVFLDFVGRTIDALADFPEAIDKLEKVWGLG